MERTIGNRCKLVHYSTNVFGAPSLFNWSETGLTSGANMFSHGLSIPVRHLMWTSYLKDHCNPSGHSSYPPTTYTCIELFDIYFEYYVTWNSQPVTFVHIKCDLKVVKCFILKFKLMTLSQDLDPGVSLWRPHRAIPLDHTWSSAPLFGHITFAIPSS